MLQPSVPWFHPTLSHLPVLSAFGTWWQASHSTRDFHPTVTEANNPELPCEAKGQKLLDDDETSVTQSQLIP